MTTVQTEPGGHKVDIPGWFFWLDRQLFASLLAAECDTAVGDLVEIGTYLGKSAVVIGNHLRPGERFVALDLFGRTDLLTDAHQTNRREVERSYATLTRRRFEENYLSWHDRLPVIVEGPSSVIMDHVGPGSVRFVHIDGSHLYDHVRLDAAHAKAMLRPGGLVVFDDWRSEHTPGVAGAVWESVFVDGLIPVALSPTKFYGVFAHPEPHRAAIQAMLDADPRIWSEVQQIAGHPVFRVNLRDKPKPAAPPPVSAEGLARTVSEQVAQTVRAEAERSRQLLLGELPELLNAASTITRIRRRLRRWRQ